MPNQKAPKPLKKDFHGNWRKKRNDCIHFSEGYLLTAFPLFWYGGLDKKSITYGKKNREKF